MKSHLNLMGLEAELKLQQNCNVVIEERLNKIEENALGKFRHL